MNSSACKVGEIFREAGTAFNKLSEITTLLGPIDEEPSGKWADVEVDMLRGTVHRFAFELHQLSQHIKNRTVTQIRSTLKKKAFEDAGIPLREVSHTVSTYTPPAPQPALLPLLPPAPLSVVNARSVIGNNAEVTLNMLNAMENEIDVDEVKLEFEAPSDEVTTG